MIALQFVVIVFASSKLIVRACMCDSFRIDPACLVEVEFQRPGVRRLEEHAWPIAHHAVMRQSELAVLVVIHRHHLVRRAGKNAFLQDTACQPAADIAWSMSIGPWPMSVFPCHVPTSVFIRSNSGELGFGFPGSPAVSHSEVASSNVVQNEVIFVFIVFLSFLVICPSFIYTTNGPARSGQHTSVFSRKKIQSIRRRMEGRRRKEGRCAEKSDCR